MPYVIVVGNLTPLKLGSACPWKVGITGLKGTEIHKFPYTNVQIYRFRMLLSYT